jgi:hypothetical protein
MILSSPLEFSFVRSSTFGREEEELEGLEELEELEEDELEIGWNDMRQKKCDD